MTWNFGTEALSFSIGHYTHGGTTAVEALYEDGASYATISVNMVDAPHLPECQFYLKSWSENALIAQAMIDEGLIEEVKPQVKARSGFVTATVYQFTELGKQYCDTQA